MHLLLSQRMFPIPGQVREKLLSPQLHTGYISIQAVDSVSMLDNVIKQYKG